MIDKLRSAHTLLQAHLSFERFSNGCNCSSCDALRNVNEAKKKIAEVITHLVSSQNPSQESEAQERSKAVADSTYPLAVALQVESGGGRYTLMYNGSPIMVGWTSEVIASAIAKGWAIIFINR